MLNSCIVYRASINFIFILFQLGLEEPFCNGLEQNSSLQEWVRIYFWFYDASAEVQFYLTSLKREKESLELPIREIVVGDLFVR